jgi:hypothetical protein
MQGGRKYMEKVALCYYEGKRAGEIEGLKMETNSK